MRPKNVVHALTSSVTSDEICRIFGQAAKRFRLHAGEPIALTDSQVNLVGMKALTAAVLTWTHFQVCVVQLELDHHEM